MADRMWRVALPAALVGAVLVGRGWMLASQGGAEAAPRKAAGRPAVAATKYDRVTDSGNVFYKVPAGYKAVSAEGAPLPYDRIFDGNVYYRIPSGFGAGNDRRCGQCKSVVMMAKSGELDARRVTGVLYLVSDMERSRTEDALAEIRRIGSLEIKQNLVRAIVRQAFDEDYPFALTEPKLEKNQARNSYEMYRVSVTFDGKTPYNRVSAYFAEHAVFLVGNRVEHVVRASTTTKADFDALGQGFEALLASIAFKNAGSQRPKRLAPPFPENLPIINYVEGVDGDFTEDIETSVEKSAPQAKPD